MEWIEAIPRFARLVGRTRIGSETEDADFLRFARKVGARPFSAALLSGGELRTGEENRYSIAAWDPFLVFRCKGQRCEIRTSRETLSFDAAPLGVLDELFARLSPDFPLVASPFSGGAVGYLAYDLKNSIERLPQTARDDLLLPDLLLFWPRKVLVFDRAEKSMDLLDIREEDFTGSEDVPFSMDEEDPSRPVPMKASAPQSNFTRDAYLDAVRKVRHYIREGDVYQVNLSQRYRFSFEGDPFQLFESLFQANPAPFYAFVHGGDHHVLSTSMERFLLRQGDALETRPIKGTRKRGATEEEDRALILDLLASAKDDAELSMIVDLLRNDLGRVCSPRTVAVAEHKRLESYGNVHHLVSIATARLRPGATYGDILRAAFPGGSITGCPKIRSMEIIDELEPNVRHIYTGSIGYLGWHENMDLNIAIRTAVIRGNEGYFSVGGGIVHDSVEADEYEETLHKGRTLFQLIENIGKNAQ